MATAGHRRRDHEPSARVGSARAEQFDYRPDAARAADTLRWPPGPEDSAGVMELQPRHSSRFPSSATETPAAARDHAPSPGQDVEEPGPAWTSGPFSWDGPAMHPQTSAAASTEPFAAASPDDVRLRADDLRLRTGNGVQARLRAWLTVERRAAIRRTVTPERLALAVLGLLVLVEGVIILRGLGGPTGTAASRLGDARGVERAVATAGTDATRAAPAPSLSSVPTSTATPASNVAQLTVRTDPAGAGVLVDGKSRGATPVTVRNLAAGEHQVVVQTRHGDIRQSVRVAEGEAISLVVPLGAAKAAGPVEGGLAINAPIELRVFDGDRLVGTSAMERMPLTPGAHRLVLRNDEVGFEQARNVTVTAGKTLPLSIDVPPQRVAVNAAPWADVWADGRHVGQTPIGNLPLSPGPHALVFRHPQWGEKSIRLLVRANEPGRVSVDMRK